MQGFEKFKMRMQASGSSLRQERINTIRNLLDTTFADDPSYYSNVVVLNKPVVNCRIYDFNSPTKRDGVMRCMTEYSRPLLKGDLLFWQDIWWLCTHQQNIHGMYWNGVIERTNHLLKWKDADGNVIECYCKAEDNTKYTTGEKDEDFEMILPDTRRLIKISYNKDTIKLAEGQRLIIDKKVPNPKVYKITNVDRVSNVYESDEGINGVINIICVADLFNTQTDNAELMIADYYSNDIIYNIKILNHNQTSPLLLNAGDTFHIEVLATKNGEICDKCDVLFHSENEDIVTVSADGLVVAISDGNCNITITYETEIITLSVEVQAGAILDTYSISIIDADNDTEIVYGDTNDAHIKTYKNGIENTSITFEYELLNAAGIAQIQRIVENTITLFALNNSKNVNKTFELRVWNDVLGIEDVKQFKVVGLF